jgi:DNA replication ATP-dependent helicase Dna2
LKDWRRINVSLTRARSKLVICGSRKTLGLVLTDLFSVIEEKGWVYKLPADALEVHHSVEEAAGPSKRSAQGTDEIDDESSSDLGTPRPKKRSKTATASLEGILNGRPILKDVINMTEG